MDAPSRRIKSALFVDFDNIFLGLNAEDAAAAEEFATSPGRWLRWIQDKMPVPLDDDGLPVRREILVRKCYGNPDTMRRYRGYFTRSAFSVVDCPPLTGRGKNSADIVMVMDILDVLAHPTRFDEFIVMSSDADFTPLFLRLRMHDRRIAAIVAGNVAAAYKAACDLVVPDDTFVDEALEVAARPSPAPGPRTSPSTAPATSPAAVPTASPDVLDAIARRVYEEASGNGEVLATTLPAIFREFREFTPTSNWLGFFSLRAMTEAVVGRRPDIQIAEGDPWRITVRLLAPVPPPALEAGAPAAAEERDGPAALRARVVEVVRELVAASPEPVVMARAAHEVVRALGQRVLDTQWAGEGTFKNLLESVEGLGLTIVSSPQPGFLYDPARHEAPAVEPRADNLADLPDALAQLIRRVSAVTGAPRLSPRQYGILFEVIAKEVQRAPYNLNSTSKAVRDQIIERGENVSRQYASFVLRGVTFTGYRFRGIGVVEAPAIAQAFRGNVTNLLRSAQVVLDEHELELLDEWLLGGLGVGAPAAPEPAWSEERDEAPAFADPEPVAWSPSEPPAAEPEPVPSTADAPSWPDDRADATSEVEPVAASTDPRGEGEGEDTALAIAEELVDGDAEEPDSTASAEREIATIVDGSELVGEANDLDVPITAPETSTAAREDATEPEGIEERTSWEPIVQREPGLSGTESAADAEPAWTGTGADAEAPIAPADAEPVAVDPAHGEAIAEAPRWAEMAEASEDEADEEPAVVEDWSFDPTVVSGNGDRAHVPHVEAAPFADYAAASTEADVEPDAAGEPDPIVDAPWSFAEPAVEPEPGVEDEPAWVDATDDERAPGASASDPLEDFLDRPWEAEGDAAVDDADLAFPVAGAADEDDMPWLRWQRTEPAASVPPRAAEPAASTSEPADPASETEAERPAQPDRAWQLWPPFGG